MRALAFKQPWGHAALYWGKGLDNRRQKNGRMPHVCRHRGPLLIHASAGETRKYFDDALCWMRDHQVISQEQSWIAQRDPTILRGGIIGRCVVIAHCDPDGRVWLDPDGTQQDPEVTSSIDMRWHMKDSWGLVIADRGPLPFMACKGGLGLFEVEYSALANENTPLAARRQGPPKFVLLDIDGVLNEARFLHEVAKQEGGRLLPTTQWDPKTHLDSVRIEKLNRIVERTGARVVISSSWRCAFELPKLRELLGAKGFAGEIVDATPRLHGHERHVEIRRWLSARSDEPAFVILDDDHDAGVGFGARFIHVPSGLEDEHVERAVRMLS